MCISTSSPTTSPLSQFSLKRTTFPLRSSAANTMMTRRIRIFWRSIRLLELQHTRIILLSSSSTPSRSPLLTHEEQCILIYTLGPSSHNTAAQLLSRRSVDTRPRCNAMGQWHCVDNTAPILIAIERATPAECQRSVQQKPRVMKRNVRWRSNCRNFNITQWQATTTSRNVNCTKINLPIF